MNTFKTCVKISLVVMLLLTASEPARAQPEVNIERVSEAPGGLQSNNESGSPAISSNGRYVAFDSYASNLVSGDTNDYVDVFRPRPPNRRHRTRLRRLRWHPGKR